MRLTGVVQLYSDTYDKTGDTGHDRSGTINKMFSAKTSGLRPKEVRKMTQLSTITGSPPTGRYQERLSKWNHGSEAI